MPPKAARGETHGTLPFATLANDPTRRPCAARPRPTMVSPRIALGLLIVLSGCTTYQLTMIPPARALQPEQQLTAALVARMAADGWLDREEAR